MKLGVVRIQVDVPANIWERALRAALAAAARLSAGVHAKCDEAQLVAERLLGRKLEPRERDVVRGAVAEAVAAETVDHHASYRVRALVQRRPGYEVEGYNKMVRQMAKGGHVRRTKLVRKAA